MGDYNFNGNDSITEERIALSMERIRAVPEESGRLPGPFHGFFSSAAAFLNRAGRLRELLKSGRYGTLSLAEMQELQRELYHDMLPENYAGSWLDPACAVSRVREVYPADRKKEGEELGRLLSALYAELFGILKFIYEDRAEDTAPYPELFLQVYGLFTDGIPSAASVKDAVYWYAFDYLDVTVPERNRELLLPRTSEKRPFAEQIPERSDPRSLFFSGDYISESTLQIHSCLRDLPEEKLETAARTFTEGFAEGFRVMGRDLSKKKRVALRMIRGFERLAERESELFREAGLETVLPGSPVRLADRVPGSQVFQLSLSPNRQFCFDHRYDHALFWDKAFTERKITELKNSYEELKADAGIYAGPAVMEYFGEKDFTPVNKPEAYRLSGRQLKLLNGYQAALSELRDIYIPGDETSFTIISWPIPEIGEFYPALFDDIIRINTSDNDFYRSVQQKIIDVLDRAAYVEVKGAGGNETDLKIALRELKDPEKETRFENCVSDVNIPAGEVFTSPVLEGTEGLLHVQEVFVDGLQVKELRIRVERGRARSYSCANFTSAEENRRFVREVVMGDHEELPMGEFAIGTNTDAFAVAKKYGIGRQMPILIAEKTGPHFAFGDTCYSHEEDTMTYNPDGKAIVARDNEISAKRKEDPASAYFGHHKDITIPYREIGRLTAVMPDGNGRDIIRGGRFVLEGTEELNRWLDRSEQR